MVETSHISIHRTRPAMGTLFEVLLRGEDAEHLAAVADAVLDEVQRIERLLSRFDPRSEISRINRLAATEDVLVDHEVAALLKTCFDARERTGGAFDITATSPASGRRKPPGTVAPANHSQFSIDPFRRLIRFTSPDTQLDLGGIGKGYALDRAAELLDEYGIEHALLHGGTSSVLARGRSTGEAGWIVALPHGKEVLLANESLSCSATNQQADITDPASGLPVTAGAGVAVVAAIATEAEILSTALLCLERRTARDLIAARQVQAFWFDSESC